MTYKRTQSIAKSIALAILLPCVVLANECQQREADVKVSSTKALQHALKYADAGSLILLQEGVYQGEFIIDKSMHLVGEHAMLDAHSKGSAITITASHVSLCGLRIQSWGNDLYQQNAAINVKPDAEQVVIKYNQLQGSGFGIYAEKTRDIVVHNNHITGDGNVFMLDRGDGVHLLRVENPIVTENQIRHVRDGVYLESGSGSQVDRNQFVSMQYGIHYMYTQEDRAKANHAKQVQGGYALMNSNDIELVANHVAQATEFGVLLNMTNRAVIRANHIYQTYPSQLNALSAANSDLFTQAKGVFIYGAQHNQVVNNYIGHNEVGIVMALGGENNQVYGNQFIANQTQVKYVGDTSVEWSNEQSGNYWSDYQGWDVNGDGIGQSRYVANDRLDRVFWIYPEASFLMGSPVVALLKWIDSQFQQHQSSGVIDSFPLINPPLLGSE
ncbi:nitrous oxide reductase family maturation protein NosD [Shewanella maritima]|uniref:nitrous oxide reductase family maturation protein NosD n=1 Tax=Shewanella maritima TaxID=2520507 RepID=UPI003735826B